MSKIIRYYIKGSVQGIGFRPFIYRIAKNNRLVGQVRNLGDAGVEIIVMGNPNQISSFERDLKEKKPSLAEYDQILVENLSEDKNSFSDFTIVPSSTFSKGPNSSYLPPDLAICDECITDMNDQVQKSRYLYPFTSCVNCGPRYTVIWKLPYDRPRTEMINYPFCPTCLSEYTNPMDRRFHAQTTCCSECGPNYWRYKRGKSQKSKLNDKILLEIAEGLNRGEIIVIKGIGGTHIACSARDSEAVLQIRQWKKKRFQKPFAVMSRDLKEVSSFAETSIVTNKLLESIRRPIVLIPKNSYYSLSELIAPGLGNVGAMLPYAGIHHLILQQKPCPPTIVMTSANPSHLPMVIDNEQIIQEFDQLSDQILIHDRNIFQRNDDSVIRILSKDKNDFRIIRRSRGYVPEPIKLPTGFNLKTPVLGTGADMHVTPCLLIDNSLFFTQYIGTMGFLETFDYYKRTIQHLKKLFGVQNFSAVGCDFHPEFTTTQYAEEIMETNPDVIFRVQHHHAHLLSLALENSKKPLDRSIIGIVADGMGWGLDKTVWGGEILEAIGSNFTRLGHCELLPLPGGDIATHFPGRILTALLHEWFEPNKVEQIVRKSYLQTLRGGLEEVQVIDQQITEKFNTQHTSSLGRVLDVISIVLGICNYRSYEGEPAIKLEGAAMQNSTNDTLGLTLQVVESKKMAIFNTKQLVRDILDMYQTRKHSRKMIAKAVHLVIGKTLAEVASNIAKERNSSEVGFTGGIAYNKIFNNTIQKIVKNNSKEYLAHRKIPPGDAGISAGQSCVAFLKNNRE